MAAVAAAAVLSASVPATAFADSVDDIVNPRITTVNRTDGLAPEGDTVTVSGTGHDPGSRIEITTRAVPAEAADTEDADESAVLDTENTVLTEVDEDGLFTVDLDTGVDFAAEAGLDATGDPFEIVLTEAEDGDGESERGGWAEGDAPAESPGESTAESTTESAAESGEPSPDEVVSAPGPGRSAPVLAPAAPRNAPTRAASVVAVVPVSFAAPANAPQAQPPTTNPPQSPNAPQTQAAPQTVPQNPADLTLTVSKTSGLDPDGESVTVTGNGYDTSKGIYVALCDTANASATQAPSPCIGGVDMDGGGGASAWVSSNPPPYGEGLATPYTGSGTNGGFTVELTVKGSDEHTDCLSAATDCAVVTRNDHTRSSDRGQDKFVPVTFSGQTGDPGSGGSGGSGSGSGNGSGSGSGDSGNNSTGNGAGGNSSGSGSGSSAGGSGSGGGSSLPTTGTALTGLVLAAAVAVLAGAVAMFAARRRTGEDPATTA
ncbi:cell wall protein [Nocardiopsis exhalans]|uniref:Cell wall protein n=1 Tax=Nocardiopsis exhalans TaxID=163604 RepID=A0ABY5DER7_9ACTN|nr:cell wall protein [Nocardiopsis exhalans]USY21553.1 cell wall protein [Nocardiopsis exhalans]